MVWYCYSSKLLAVPIGRLIDDVWVRVLVSHLRATWSTTQARIGVSFTALRAYESLSRVRVEASIMHIPFSGSLGHTHD
jgi:hypothetical protein